MPGRALQVLLTGFGPFLRFSSNPTTEIAQRLHGTCDVIGILPEPSERLDALGGDEPSAQVEVCWHAYVLPVNRTGAMWTTEHLRGFEAVGGGRQPYDAVFHIGLEDSAKGLKLEVAAANVQADDSGAQWKYAEAVQGADDVLPTTVNIGWLSRKNIVIHGSPERGRLSREIEVWSRDPGSFYCNEVYFRTLHYVRSRPLAASTGALLPVMFIHVQNEMANSVGSDIDSIRQIAAHALWATYVAPGPQPIPFALAAPVALPTGGSASFCVALLCFACFLLGGLLPRLRPGRGAASRHAARLREPLVSAEPGPAGL